MLPPPPRSPRTDTRSPYPTLFLSYPPAGAADLADAPGGALSARISRAAGNQGRLPRPRDGPGRRDRDHAPADPPLRHGRRDPVFGRSEEPTSELQSLMRISYAVFRLKENTKELKSQMSIYTN